MIVSTIQQTREVAIKQNFCTGTHQITLLRTKSNSRKLDQVKADFELCHSKLPPNVT